MKVTQKDIAERVGSSTSLVSRVLSGQAHKIGVNPKKVEEIFRIAKEMNYIPNPSALVLKGKKTRTLGLVVYDFCDPYFSMLIGDIQAMSHLRNYSTLLVGFLDRKPNDADLMPLYKHCVDGIIVLGTGGDLSWTDSFRDIPVARIGHVEHPNLALSVGVDEDDAMRRIFAHLKNDSGVGRAAYAARPLEAHQMRRKAVERAAQEHGVELEGCPAVADADSDFEVGVQFAESLIARGRAKFPQAVVCATDSIATGVIKRLHESSIAVPDDIAVTGFDDIPAAANYIPSITSFRQPTRRFAQECFDAMEGAVQSPTRALKGELIIRKSSMRQFK